jgi:hypothetical protein
VRHVAASLRRLRVASALSHAAVAAIAIIYFQGRVGGVVGGPTVVAAYAVYIAGTAFLAWCLAHRYVSKRGWPWIEAMAVPVVITILSAMMAALALALVDGIYHALNGRVFHWSAIPKSSVYAAFVFLITAWPALLVSSAGASLVMCRRGRAHAQAD